MNLSGIIGFSLYLITIFIIAISVSKFSSSGIKALYIGNRQINRFLVAVSSVISGRSTWLLLFLTGQSYLMGFSAIWIFLGYIIAELFLLIHYAPRIKDLAERYDSITLPGLVSARLNDKKGYLRLIISVIIILYAIVFISAQVVSGAKLLFSNFGTDQKTGIIFSAVFLLFVSMLGGFKGLIYSDLLNSIFFLIIIILLPVISYYDLGGTQEIQTRIGRLDPKYFNPFVITSGLILGSFAHAFSSPGNPHVILRFMSVSHRSHFQWIAKTGTLLNITFAFGALLIGITARVYFPNIESLPSEDHYNSFITLSSAVLPPSMAGIVLAIIIGSFISSSSSYTLIASSSLTSDIYEKFFHKKQKISSEKLILFSRIAFILIIYLVIAACIYLPKSITWYMEHVWKGLAVSAGPVMLFLLFWKKTTTWGFVTGLLAGLVFHIIWNISFPKNSLDQGIISCFLFTGLITMIVSLIQRFFTRKKDLKKVNNKKVIGYRTELEDGN